MAVLGIATAAFADGLPSCGTMYPDSNGISSVSTDTGTRACTSPAVRTYKPMHRGIGFDVLDLESEACFVPDAAYRLLDDIVADAASRARAAGYDALSAREKALLVGRITNEVLRSRGFRLEIPVYTLSDGLTLRSDDGAPPRFIFDCDVGSLIVMTVAEALGLPVALVEITLESGDGHNYVQFPISGNAAVNWDTNGAGECKTPSGQKAGQGVAMTYNDVISYVLEIRVGTRFDQWRTTGNLDYIRLAVEDEAKVAKLNPKDADRLNTFSWHVATRDFPGREEMKAASLEAATAAVRIDPSPEYRDTLACAYALNGDFKRAIREERAIVKLRPDTPAFRENLASFTASPPRGCAVILSQTFSRVHWVDATH